MIQGLIPTDRRLFEIADDLCTYMETLEMVQADATHDPEQIKELRAQIDRLGSELVKKADNIAGVLRRIKNECKQIAAEEMRLTARRIAFENSAKWLKSITMSTMRENGWTYMKSPTVTLSIQGNGGIQPLVIDGEVPPEFKDITVKMPLALFEIICNEWEETSIEVRGQIKQVALEPSQARIREALARPCPACEGKGMLTEFSSCFPCETCKGTGKNQVPGAHLGERGERLVIH